MTSFTFRQVDVFTSEPYRGNPVAVVHDAVGVSDEALAQFANWTNLSETTFLLPPTDPAADYRVRIFTPGSELPFAGHPTIGTCHAWLEAGGVPHNDNVIIQECAAGLITIRRDETSLAFAAPPQIRTGPLGDEDLAAAIEILGINASDVIDSHWIDNGPGWLGIELASAEKVLSLRPNAMVADDYDVGVFGRYPDGSECDIEVRAFFRQHGGNPIEDPVTGSLNASLAQWQNAKAAAGAGGLATPYVASQGTCLGRRGRVHISTEPGPDGDLVWVGGEAVTCIQGTVALS